MNSQSLSGSSTTKPSTWTHLSNIFRGGDLTTSMGSSKGVPGWPGFKLDNTFGE